MEALQKLPPNASVVIVRVNDEWQAPYTHPQLATYGVVGRNMSSMYGALTNWLDERIKAAAQSSSAMKGSGAERIKRRMF